jgi:hypothetical protein
MAKTLSFRGASNASEPGIQKHPMNAHLDSGSCPSGSPGMTETGYWPQFQHKTEPSQSLAAVSVAACGGGSLAPKNLSVLGATAPAGGDRDPDRGGTLRS